MMTEAEWLACTDPMPMLEFLQGMASDRKLRLIACAYCRLFWRFMGKASQKAILLGEQMADGPVNENYREAVVRAAVQAVCRFEETSGDFFRAADIAYRIPCNDGRYAVEWTVGNWPGLPESVPIVRDLFGNPFRPPPVIAPAVLAWQEATVPRLVQVIYEGRRFEELPILADALEEAGCEDVALLAHCREPGPHVLGCWAVDSILGKN